MNNKVNCLICGVEFTLKRKNSKQKVCSIECRHLWCSKIMKGRLSKPKVKLGLGYWGIYKPDHPRAESKGYVLEHILVWEEAYNMKLPHDWLIHHKNGNKRDNRIENLEAMPKSKHTSSVLIQELQNKVEVQETRIKLLEWQVRELNRQLNDMEQLKQKKQGVV